MGGEFSSFREVDCLKIVVVGPKNGEPAYSELCYLPRNAKIISTGSTYAELVENGVDISVGNAILNLTGNADTLPKIVTSMPVLFWFHSASAGLDGVLCSEIINNDHIVVTNAKGVYSSGLAEYVLGCCLHFAKNMPRFMKQKSDHHWEKFCVNDLKGATMGIIGYGDIGKACGKLGKAFGMKVVGARRRPELSDGDEYIEKVYGMDGIGEVMQQSDYIVVALPLVNDTHQLINKSMLLQAKTNCVLINIGRGQLVDEVALIDALRNNTIAGAALDVFAVEPLPQSSPLWDLENVFISPHCADMTIDRKQTSVKLFTENCARCLSNQELLCVADKTLGY